MRYLSFARRQEAGAVQPLPSDLPSFNRARYARQSAARNTISQTIRRMMKRTGCVRRAKQGTGGGGSRTGICLQLAEMSIDLPSV